MNRPYKDKDPGYFIASHVQTDGPAQALRDYLVTSRARVVFAACPLEDAAIAAALLSVYAEGKKLLEYAGHARIRKGVWLWLQDAWFVWRWGWRLLKPGSVFIGVDNLNAIVGLGLKLLGHGGKVVYYVIDYTPQRFASPFLNAVYQLLARLAARYADEVWNLSERMQAVHARFGTRPARNRLVPIGVDASKFSVAPRNKIKARQMVMVSTLYKNKGVQLGIQALPQLPRVTLAIIGGGPEESNLRQLAAELGVEKRVRFLGELERSQLFQVVAESRLALAPYLPAEHTYTYYADPAKPKEYLACGVPVIITRVPWIAEPIEKLPMGCAIGYDKDELAAAANKLLDDERFWLRCRKNALRFMAGCDWECIFKRALGK